MSTIDERSLDALLAAARSRESPWDAERGERVLSNALTTRATRARNKVTRFTVASACGAVLLVGFGIANGAGLAFAPKASAQQGAHQVDRVSSRSDATQESSDGREYSADHNTAENQPPSASELAALARNDGGYGRD